MKLKAICTPVVPNKHWRCQLLEHDIAVFAYNGHTGKSNVFEHMRDQLRELVLLHAKKDILTRLPPAPKEFNLKGALQLELELKLPESVDYDGPIEVELWVG